jgi:hypothetical protein
MFSSLKLLPLVTWKMAPPVLTLTGRCIVSFQLLSNLTFQDLATEIPFTSKQPRVLRSVLLAVKSESRISLILVKLDAVLAVLTCT